MAPALSAVRLCGSSVDGPRRRHLETSPRFRYNGGTRGQSAEMRAIMTHDIRLAAIREKVEAGARLSFDDGLYLDEYADLFTLGELANLVRERKNGNFAYYNVNTHLNPTNVCVYRCIFCAFRSDLRDPKGYLMSDEQILARGQEAVDSGCTEMNIVGGLHNQQEFDWYLYLIIILYDITT